MEMRSGLGGPCGGFEAAGAGRLCNEFIGSQGHLAQGGIGHHQHQRGTGFEDTTHRPQKTRQFPHPFLASDLGVHAVITRPGPQLPMLQGRGVETQPAEPQGMVLDVVVGGRVGGRSDHGIEGPGRDFCW